MLTDSQCRNIINLELHIDQADTTPPLLTYWDLTEEHKEQVCKYADRFLGSHDWSNWVIIINK